VRLSVIVVTHNSRESLGRILPRLLDQATRDDELVIVDNGSSDGTPEAVAAVAPEVKLIRNTVNEGFAAACNVGAEAASGNLLLLLNPDVEPAEGFCHSIRTPLREGRGWAAWMGLVTAEGGGVINTSGGVVHFTGICWAGQAGEPLARAPTAPREVAFVSGACLAIGRDTWFRHGGLPSGFFLYHEDVDLSLRLRLVGERLGLEPSARVDHDYEFAKGELKWRLLERNRWATLVRTYPGALLVLLAPALAATEIALVPISVAGGWGRQKLLATLDTVRALPRLARERRAIQATRLISAGDFASYLTADLSSSYLGRPAGSTLLRWVLQLYWRLVLALLRAPAR
jgi:N-acetylglucosaminyl-diphospho-decaprenol L-rhamnosyltransferase